MTMNPIADFTSYTPAAKRLRQSGFCCLVTLMAYIQSPTITIPNTPTTEPAVNPRPEGFQ